jgi:hypothetical protein
VALDGDAALAAFVRESYRRGAIADAPLIAEVLQPGVAPGLRRLA